MADKLTSIKIKQKNGSYTSQIPIGVSAQNVQWDGTHSLLDILGSVDVNTGGKGNVQHQFDDIYENINNFTDNINISVDEIENSFDEFQNNINQNINDFTDNINTSVNNYTENLDNSFDNFKDDINQHLSDVLGNIDTSETGKGNVQHQMDQLYEDVTNFHTQMTEQIGTNVTNWLQNNVTPVGSAVTIDKTLAISDSAADAKITGQALQSKINKINVIPSTITSLKSIVESGTYLLKQNSTFDDLPQIYSNKIPTASYLEVMCDNIAGVCVQRLNLMLTNAQGAPTVCIRRFNSNSGNILSDWEIISRHKSSMSLHGMDIMDVYRQNVKYRLNNGVTYEYDEKLELYHISGETSNNSSFCNLCIPIPAIPNKKYYFYFSRKTDKIHCKLYYYNSSENLINGNLPDIDGFFNFTMPEEAKTFYLRLEVLSNTSEVDEYANVWITDKPIGKMVWDRVRLNHSEEYLSSCNLNDLYIENGSWLLISNQEYENKPIQKNGTSGFLYVDSFFNNWALQTYISADGTQIFRRRRNNLGSWNSWSEITSEQTTSNLLQPSDDETDRKNDIENMLLTGCCKLAPGIYYVSGIDMPEKSTLIGSGRQTIIVLLGGDNTQGYAIRMNHGCTVKDLQINGYSATDLEQTYKTTYNYVNRHGILWEAAYETDSSTKRRGIVSGCEILNFSGGGITCNNTGTPVNSCLMVSDTFIRACSIGVNISYFSEFNIFTSVHVRACYYGCVNNGGNNLFSVCNFSANTIGMLMDNSQGQSRNNSHGSVIGCIFDHSGDNEGIGIKIDGCKNGEVFDGCQIFYSDIIVNNSVGIQFNNFNAGKQVDITVTKGTSGGVILFNNWVFTNTPFTITVDNDYDACKFINCYDASGNVVSK